MYLNRHFLSDVLFGAMIGVGCAWAVERFLARSPRPLSASPEETVTR